jgi:hypothetical protein
MQGYSWPGFDKPGNQLVKTIFVYNPVLIFTIPVFAIVCDWTEGLLLLRNGEQINPERFLQKQKRIKKFFLFVSVIVIVVMWVNIAADMCVYFSFLSTFL